MQLGHKQAWIFPQSKLKRQMWVAGLDLHEKQRSEQSLESGFGCSNSAMVISLPPSLVEVLYSTFANLYYPVNSTLLSNEYAKIWRDHKIVSKFS